MIIGRTFSADGGFRRIPIRHIQIVDKQTREILVSYLKDALFKKCQEGDWIGIRDIFPIIPDDILYTPLKVVYEICDEKFNHETHTINVNVAKYIGMLVREAAYYSDEHYYEQFVGSVRKYSLVSKGLDKFDFEANRRRVLDIYYKK